MEKHRTNGPGSRRSQSRICLMCREGFSSVGPHNRVCERCKLSRAWREGSLDYAAIEHKARR